MNFIAIFSVFEDRVRKNGVYNLSTHHGKKGVKWDIDYNFSEKTTITIAAEIVLREDVIRKVKGITL